MSTQGVGGKDQDKDDSKKSGRKEGGRHVVWEGKKGMGASEGIRKDTVQSCQCK